jgi:hypothetical protein
VKLMLEDLRELHSAIGDAAGALAPINVELLAFMIGADLAQADAAARVSKMAGATMHQIARAQDATMRITDLLGGRCDVLDREAEGEES